MAQAAFIIFVIGFAMTSWLTMQKQQMTDDWAEKAARHFSTVTQIAASRMYEMGSNFVTAPNYAAGTAPTPGSLDWLKDPNNCSIATIPALPNKENGDPVSRSFLPCDFSDTSVWGHNYSITWNTAYPGTTMEIQLGGAPFQIDGEVRPEVGGKIAAKAEKFTYTQLGDSTLDLMISYNFDPSTGTLTATVDRTAAFSADPYLRVDGTNMMDATASIEWGNGMEIKPDNDEMHISATDGVFIFDETTIEADTTVKGQLTVEGPTNTASIDDGFLSIEDGVVEGTKVNGSFDALLSRAVFDYRVLESGDTVTKPSCPASSTPQIFAAASSVPVGEGMYIQIYGGGSVAGDVKRFRARADDLGSQWQVWAEAYISGTWRKLAGSDGELRAAIKCT